MMRNFICSILVIVLVGCQDRPKMYGTSDIDVIEVQKEVAKWYQYHYYYIDLNSDYEALDTNFSDISKKVFLEKLSTGSYLAARLHSVKGTLFYKLFELKDHSDPNIGKAVENLAKRALKHYLLEGRKLPTFQFEDLNGNLYTNSNAKGKILVIMNWFIDCAPCVNDIPTVNFLKKKYSNENVLFLGLSFDEREDLISFNEEEEFNYNIIPVEFKFIRDRMRINEFPAHILVNSTGKILKVMNDTKSLKNELENFFGH